MGLFTWGFRGIVDSHCAKALVTARSVTTSALSRVLLTPFSTSSYMSSKGGQVNNGKGHPVEGGRGVAVRRSCHLPWDNRDRKLLPFNCFWLVEPIDECRGGLWL